MTTAIETADVVIIGGGVMGCSIACNLALTADRHGLRRIVLLERDTLGSGSTGRSSGAIRMHYSTAVNAELAWRSLQIFRNFDSVIGGDCGFVETGYLVFAGPDDLESFRSNIAMQQSVGVITDIISAPDAAGLAPGFAVEDAAAIAYEPYSGHADASGTAYAYATRARSEGVSIRLQTPVESIELTADGSRVKSVIGADGTRFETPNAVIATGPWSARFLSHHGIEAPLRATRHEVLHFRRPLDLVPYHPGGTDITNRIYFRPEGRELTLVGNGNHSDLVDDPELFAQRASPDFIQDVWQRLARRIPPIADAELAAGYAGLYTNTPDSHPIMDSIDGVDGLYLCTGFSGHGFKLSPMVGVLMAELIGHGAATTMDISPLRLSRFVEGDMNNAGYGFDVLV